jgi:hypothetical protein
LTKVWTKRNNEDILSAIENRLTQQESRMPETYQVRIRMPFVAVCPKGPGVFEPVTLEPGTIVTVQAEHTVLRTGLVHLLDNGKTLAAYLRDIEDRTERVEAYANAG